MRKQHPIRKMQQAENAVWGKDYDTVSQANAASLKVLARHVKPLLDALMDPGSAWLLAGLIAARMIWGWWRGEW